ncbi:Uncharacterised protein [Vibrio cholerae]|uniref:Uncharacterized protein n=1 Tax=Vibrio cholerae TaxID=666 RepID=A0A656ANW5_VIBCL|nr:Uncharacterised protein [Vibrio cholerae]CSB40184.1 Uncharacterised protein [Vibrio cholerae]CSC02429.1 Uncharacterised protein [Vibrio cholerae]CSD21655.1 Uncharacterised protein [Vibrio cholerae]CSD23209.1 Uncharacterised protein [Vibrio cholerae]
MGLTLIAVEEHAWASVQLGYDNPLSTIDYEGTIFCHERNFAHVDFLFFNIFDSTCWRVFIKDH